MRIIKFRGKDSNGNWHYGDLIHSSKGEFVRIHDYDEDAGFYRWFSDIDPATVGQFTNLYDKDHNEIYEGDILAVQGVDEKLEVRFVRGIFAFLWNGDLDDEFPTNALTYEWAGVVGNIYDNKDLLKKGGEEQ